MAIQSYGYPPLIADGADFARMAYGFGRQYVAPFESHCRVTASPTGTRRVTITPGYLAGKHIVDYNDATVTLDLPQASGASQWFAIVLKRWVSDGVGGFKSEFGWVAGSDTRAIPAMTQNPGTSDFQPIALVRIVALETVPQTVVDLRAIAEEPGTYTVYDDLAMQVIQRNGVTAYNAATGLTYRYVYIANKSLSWQRVYDTPAGVRPYFMLGRNAPYTADSPAGPYKAFGANQTDTDGDWSTHFTHTGGSSNAAPGYIQVKTDGLYSINGRLSTGSSSAIRGWVALEGGWSRITDAHETRSNPGTAILNVSDTVFLKAGARVMLVGRFYDAFRVQDWYLWMNRIGD